jgi:hypothetical protein
MHAQTNKHMHTYTIHIQVWHSGQHSPIGTVIDAVTAASDTQRPHVLAFSYGGTEQSFPRPSLNHLNNGFKALGVMGVSVLVSSGDR